MRVSKLAEYIISVGYRVNSAQATRFRIWATNTLPGVYHQGICA
jgi:hypothetical protein